MADHVTIGDLIPQGEGKNARKHTPRNIGMIAASLQEVGAARSIVIDENNEILAGNGTWEAAGQIGIERVRVVEADGNELIAVRRTGLTGDQKKRLALADNRTAELAEWDVDVLAQLKEQDGILDGLFRDDELDALLASVSGPEPGGGGDEFDTTPQDGPTMVQRGDVWRIGEHRLMCGDSTSADDVARLMGDALADMVFTDPPYGVDYEGGANARKREKLIGDASGDLYGECMSLAVTYSKDSAPWYIWFGGNVAKPVYDAVSANGYTVRAMIVWNKQDAHYGNWMAQYMQKHEPCLYCVKAPPPWHGATNEVTVWDVKQPSRNEEHPTQKPLELAERAIRNSSARSALIADWFLGSGTTLIAAQRTGRKCYGMEISERYCDVVLRRAEAEGITPIEKVSDGAQE